MQAGLRVVLPGQAAARYVRHPMTACAAHGAAYLLVHAIMADTGTSSALGALTRSPA